MGLSTSCAHCQRERPGRRALKPPAQSHTAREEQRWHLRPAPHDCTPDPSAPLPGPWSTWSGPSRGAPQQRPLAPCLLPDSTCSCARSGPGRTPHLLLQPKQRPGPARHRVSCPFPRLDSRERIRSAPLEPSTVKEQSPLPVTPIRAPRLTEAACTHLGLAGSKGRQESPRASKLQFLWGRCQPQLFGAY